MAIEPDEYILSANEKNLSRNGLFIEPQGPELFTLNMLAGLRSGLQELNTILLSASTANALFNNVDPIGKIVKINDVNVKVTGVYEDLPHNSKFHDVQFFSPFDLYVTFNPRLKEQGWKNHSVYIYVQLQPNSSFNEASEKIKDALMINLKNMEGLNEMATKHPQLFLHPMRDWHLYGDFKEGVSDYAALKLVRMLGIIGSFVLLLACINFMNLASARSEKRAKEVGIRKAIGSRRRQLIGQFIVESLLAVICAFVLALIVVSVLLSLV
jgi:ABC-type antimicrobial peptide transport system permease subunit